MQSSNVPANLQLAFAASASASYKRQVPVPSQAGAAASFTDGFPPATFLTRSAGGQLVDGRDINGILNQITTILQWMQAGFFPAYNPTFSAQIGGYPLGAILRRTDGKGFWRSTAENNVTNPDTGGAGWAVHGVPTVFGRTGDVVATNGDYNAAQVGALAANAFATQSLGTNGYQVMPGGLILQWGQTASIAEDTETTFTFPIPFPAACYNVQATCDYGGHTDSDVIAQVTNITTTNVKIMRDSGGGAGYNGVVYVFAVGR